MSRGASSTVRPSRAAAQPDPFADIVVLARKCPSRSRLYRDSLGIIVRHLKSPYGAVHVRYHSEVIQDEAHSGPQDPRFWKSNVQLFLTESLAEGRARARLLKSKAGDTRVALLSSPVYDPAGPAIGAMALVVYVTDDAEWTARLAVLEALCRLISFGAEFVGMPQGEAATARGTDGAIAKAASVESLEEFAFAITNELCNKLGCNQVALATVERKTVRIRSISGLDQVGSRTPGVVILKSAMEECLDAGQPIQHPTGEQWSKDTGGAAYRLHRQWHAAAKGDFVASIPMKVGGQVAAVLSLRRGKDQPLSREQLDQIAARVGPMIPALSLVGRAQRGLVRHARDSVRSAASGLCSPGRVGRKIGFAAAIALLGFFCFGRMDYRVRVPCVVGVAEARHVSSPFAGVLAATHVIPGDQVQRGQALAELDHRDLDQQAEQLSAQWTVLDREKDRALAGGSPVEVALAVANQKLVEAKLAITRARIQRAVLLAPIDGVVILGDLRPRVGDRLAEGEPLFQIAAPGSWRLELDIPEHALSQVTAGMPGDFVTFGKPEHAQSFHVDRVQPASRLRHDQNVFVAEAVISHAAPWVRPGMEGFARIEAGPRPVRWIVLHRAADYLRLHFWL